MRRLLLLGEKGLVHLCKAIPKGYMDETVCFFQALPDKTLAHTKKLAKKEKKAKISITLAFFVNDAG